MHVAGSHRRDPHRRKQVVEGRSGRSSAICSTLLAAATGSPLPRWSSRICGSGLVSCFAAVAKDAGHVEEVLDSVERFVWSHPEIEVCASEQALARESTV